MRRPLLLLLKAAISILLLYVSLRSVNVAALAERLSRVNAGWIVAALLLQAVQVALQALRWRTIAAGLRRKPDAGRGGAHQLRRSLLQSGTAIDHRRRRRAHLAARPLRRRLGQRHLFRADRPRRRHSHAGADRHCLPAMDADAGAGSRSRAHCCF